METWDISAVTNFDQLAYNVGAFNDPGISMWNTSHVTSMWRSFRGGFDDFSCCLIEDIVIVK